MPFMTLGLVLLSFPSMLFAPPKAKLYPIEASAKHNYFYMSNPSAIPQPKSNSASYPNNKG